MAVSGYGNEQQLAAFMERTLGRDELAASLDWSVMIDYDDAVDETLLILNITDLTTVTGATALRRLRAVARAEVWRAVMQRTAGDYDATIDGDSYKRSQLHDHAALMYADARAEAVALGVSDYDTQQKPSVVATTISRRGYDVS